MNDALKRILSVFLVLVMCISLVPASAWAESEIKTDSEQPTEEPVEYNALIPTDDTADMYTADLEEIPEPDASADGVSFGTSEPSLNISYGELKCGTPITFTATLDGVEDTSNTIYRLDTIFTGSGNTREMLVDSSRIVWNNPTFGYKDTNTFEFTFMASGVYSLRFAFMDKGTSPVTTGKTEITITISDTDYPSLAEICQTAVAECNTVCNTDFEKAVWLNDWLIDNCSYDNSLWYCNAEGALARHTGTCNAYTEAYKMLLDVAEIPNTQATGNGHIWSVVQLDGKWYQVDTTWNDNYNSTDDTARHLYFGLTDELMALAHSDHTVDSQYECSSLESNYFIKTGKVSQWSTPLVDTIKTKLAGGETEFDVPVAQNEYETYETKIKYSLAAYDLSDKITEDSNGNPYEVQCTYTSKAIHVSAEQLPAIVASGTCGEKLKWDLSKEGVLTISGTGAMTNYSNDSSVPWDKYRSDITAIEISEGVTSIGSHTFNNCSKVTEIRFPESITEIGDYATTNCSSLKIFVFNGSAPTVSGLNGGYLTLIAYPEAYANEYSTILYVLNPLIKITYGGTLTDCGLCGTTHIWVLDSTGKLTTSGNMMDDFSSDNLAPWYKYRDSITSIKAIGNIGDYAFFDLDKVVDISESTLKDSSTGSYCFADCDSLKSVTIPEYGFAGEYYFCGCDALESVTLVNQKTIQRGEFKDCISLINLNLINCSPTDIKPYAFYNCSSLEYSMCGGCTNIGEYAFYNSAIKKVYLNAPYISGSGYGTVNLADNALAGLPVGSVIEYHGHSNMATGYSYYINDKAYEHDRTTLYYFNSDINIGTNILWKLRDDGTLIISGSGVIKDSEYNFSNSSFWYRYNGNIKKVIIENGVESVGENVFYNLSICEVQLPDSVITLGKKCFGNCTNLTTIAIGRNMSSIGDYVFYNCSNISDIYYSKTSRDWKSINIGNNNGSLAFATLHYGQYLIDLYDGIVLLDTLVKDSGVPITLNSSIYTKVGYSFLGWANSIGATEAQYQPGDTYSIDADITLYALWEQSSILTSENFPDDSFLLRLKMLFPNGLNELEAAEITNIDISNAGISNLQGIEYFIGLNILDCRNNDLSNIDISSNTLLTELRCSNNNLKNLDVSKNLKLKFIYCDGNIIEELNVSANSCLERLDCKNNSLKSIDVSGCSKLIDLLCFKNKLDRLDLNDNCELKWLNCSNNNLNSLNIDNNTKLSTLGCSDNNLEFLNIERNTGLVSLSCSNNSLSVLNTSKLYLIDYLNCKGNKISSLNLSHSPKLTELNCSDNNLYELDVSHNKELIYLYCDGNKLNNLDLSKNEYLSYLTCSNNCLSNLNLCNNSVSNPLLSPQTIQMIQINDGYIDLKSIVGEENIANITVVSGGTYDQSCGKLLLDSDTETVIYQYSTKNSNNSIMTVRAQIIKYEVSYRWSDDYETCTATAICKTDSSYNITETPLASNVQKIVPTCTEKGTTTYTAEFESDLFTTQTKDIYIPALDHDIVPHEAKTPACTEVGWFAYDTCSRCDYTTYEEIAALDHDLIHHDAKAPTYSEVGWDEYDTCSRCDYSTYVEIPIKEYVAQGVCGDNCFWTLDYDGVLTIFGTGSMSNFDALNVAPWIDYKDLITHVDVETGVASIGGNSFVNCSQLSSVSIANTVITIGDGAFFRSGLQSLTIPSSVSEIGERAFYYCTSLSELIINCEDAVIKKDAFTGVFNVTSLTIPAIIDSNSYFDFSLYKLETLHLTGCGAMFDYSFEHKPVWAGEKEYPLCNVSLDSGITHIGNYAFYRCSHISTIAFPSSVISIGQSAFSECTGLTGKVEITSGVKSIDSSAFSGCSGITEVCLPEGLETIEDYAFGGLTSLVSTVILPSSLLKIGKGAFSGGGISSINIPKSVEDIGAFPFSSCSNLTSINVDADNPYYTSYNGCLYSKDKDIIIQYPAGKTDSLVALFSTCCIGECAFAGCKNIVELRVNFASDIEPYAFQSCENMARLQLPTTLSAISDGMCLNCFALTSIEIPQTATSIGSRAFESCRALTSVVIPENISSVGDKAFNLCRAIRQLTCKASTIKFGTNVFYDCTFAAQYPCTWESLPSCADLQKQTWTPFHVLTRIDAVAPTFAEPGNIEYWECSACKRLFRDASCEHEITVEETILPRTGYEIRYANILDSDTNPNPTYHAGTDAVMLQKASRTGYVFSGWYKDELFKTKITAIPANTCEDITIYAKLTPFTYYVVLNSNGGTGSMASLSGRKYDTDYELPANKFTRKGYSFAEWNAQKDGSGRTFTDGASYTNLCNSNSEKVILYAQWRANQYTVLFDANGGTGEMESITFVYGTAESLPANLFERTGYTFTGWKCGGKTYKNGQAISNLSTTDGATLTMVAQWAVNKGYEGYTYTIKFNGNGSTGGKTADEAMKVGTAKALTANGFTKTGYHFEGWSPTKDGKAVYSNKEKVIDLNIPGGVKEVELFAVWAPNTYTVFFNGNGGKLDKATAYTQSLTYDADADLDGNQFGRAGYTFKEWNTKKDGKGTSYGNGETVRNLTAASNGTFTLYAIWTANTYTIRFNGNGAKTGEMSDQRTSYDANIKLNANNFVRPGYTFAGWGVDDSDTVKYKDKASVKNLSAEDGEVINLIAVWTANTYTVKFNANGGKGTLPYQVYGYGDMPVAIPENSLNFSGYEFSEWNTKADGTGDSYKPGQSGAVFDVKNKGTVTLYAVWIYRVTLCNGTEMIPGYELVYNRTSAVEAESFSKTGYTLAGWNKDETKALKGTVQYKTNAVKNAGPGATLYAVWKPITYKVVFHNNIDGMADKTKTQTLTYDKQTALTANSFTWKGHTFQGWRTEDGIKTYTNKEKVINLATDLGAEVHLYAIWN